MHTFTYTATTFFTIKFYDANSFTFRSLPIFYVVVKKMQAYIHVLISLSAKGGDAAA